MSVEFEVDARLTRGGRTLLDEDLARFLRALERGASAAAAREVAGLAPSRIRRWREAVREQLGADPLERAGRRLAPSETGQALLQAFLPKNSALHVQVASGFKVPLLAVDGLVLHGGRLVAVRRRYDPHEGQDCLPGGMVEYGETVEEAVVREVREETGLRTEVEGLVGVYSAPGRDPRGHVISLAFALRSVGGELRSGSDAAGVGLLDPQDLPEMGFDHNAIVEDFLRWRRRSR